MQKCSYASVDRHEIVSAKLNIHPCGRRCCCWDLFRSPLRRVHYKIHVFLIFFQSASSGRSEGVPRLKRLWTSSAPGAGKGLFRPRMRASSSHIQDTCINTIKAMSWENRSPCLKKSNDVWMSCVKLSLAAGLFINFQMYSPI